MKITDIQSFSLHDGPGIRTVIFLAGCPLTCPWCHNPEAKTASQRLVFDASRCIGCHACAEVCPTDVHKLNEGRHIIDRTLCRATGHCTEVCPSGALSLSVRELSFPELISLAERESRLGGGGITFSGGEPLLQGEELLSVLPSICTHTAIETSGYADEDLFCRVISKIDYVMMDIKIADDSLHHRYTGVSNRPILKNLAILRKSGKPFILRTPLIPDITDTEENLAAIREIVKNDRWEMLPYNSAAKMKHERLGLPYSI